MVPLSWYFHSDTDKITVTVNPSFENIAHIWVRCYFSPALLRTLRMILCGPPMEGYNCPLTESVTPSALSLYLIDCNFGNSISNCCFQHSLSAFDTSHQSRARPESLVIPCNYTPQHCNGYLPCHCPLCDGDLSTPDHSSSLEYLLSK